MSTKKLLIIISTVFIASCKNEPAEQNMDATIVLYPCNGRWFTLKEAIMHTGHEICNLTLRGDSDLLYAMQHKPSNWHVKAMAVNYPGPDTTLLARFFSVFSGVDSLILCVNDTNVIPANLPRILPGLKYLECVGWVKNFEPGSFKDAKNLQDMKYNCDWFEPEEQPGIDNSYYDSLYRIHRYQRWALLRQLVISLADAPNLKRLHLTGFQVFSLPPEIYTLQQVEYLDLYGNGLQRLDCNLLEQMKNLKELSIGGNDLKPVPACLLNNKHFKVIM